MNDSNQSAPLNEDSPPRSPGFWQWLRQLFRPGSNSSLRRSLEDAIEEHEETPSTADDIGDEELAMLRNLLSNGRLRVDNIMVPRADIIAFSVDTPFEEMLKIFCEAAHSRLPAFRDSLDEILGMVHIKDVVRLMAAPGATVDPQARPASELLRSVLYVPPSMRVVDLLVKMRLSRTHMAVIVDEFGGTDGLVTIEDLIEQIVGDIEDEHDLAEPEPMRQLEDGAFEADARVAIEDLAQTLDTAWLLELYGEDVDTLGGLVFSLAGKVPLIGDVITHPRGLSFEIVDGDPRRIKRLRITKIDIRSRSESDA